MRRNDSIIKRNVRYFRIFTATEDDVIDRINPADICKAVRAIEDVHLHTTPEKGLVLRAVDGRNDRLTMLRIRWTDHPGTWEVGDVEGDLNLSEDTALSEPTFVRFFDGNVVAVDVNRSGPWPTALREYLQAKVGGDFENFGMVQISDRDSLERLRAIQTVKSIRVRIKSPTLARIPRAAESFFGYLHQAQQKVEAGVVDIFLKNLGRNERMNAEAALFLANYLREHSHELDDDQTQFELVGFDARRNKITYNLRHDYLVSQIEIERMDTRRANPTSAFNALGHAYNSIRGRIPNQRFFD